MANIVKSCSLFLVSAVVLMPYSSNAGDFNPYLSIAGGYNQAFDAEVQGGGINTEMDFDPGFAVSGSIGNKYSDTFRAEMEFGYRKSDIDSIAGVANGSGDLDVYSIMANLFYDLKMNEQQAFVPYVGAGLGAAFIDANNVRPIGGSSFDETNLVPAAQAIVGASYNVTDHFDIFADYRYFTNLFSYNNEYKTAAGTQVESDYDTNTVLVGVRYAFGQTSRAMPEQPAPVEPMPAPEQVDVSRSYIVFFDFDSAKVTSEAKDVINNVAHDAVRGLASKVTVTGHTDRSGSDDYNMGLSEERAKAVMHELVALGIPADLIDIRADGESRPLIDTDDGIKEPQNRRVEIVYSAK